MYYPHFVFLVGAVVLTRRREPFCVCFQDVFGHLFRRNDVVFKTASRAYGRDTAQNPKECEAEVLDGLKANAASPVSWFKRLNLNVGEAGSGSIAAQNIDVGRVPERNDRCVP